MLSFLGILIGFLNRLLLFVFSNALKSEHYNATYKTLLSNCLQIKRYYAVHVLLSYHVIRLLRQDVLQLVHLLLRLCYTKIIILCYTLYSLILCPSYHYNILFVLYYNLFYYILDPVLHIILLLANCKYFSFYQLNKK